MCPSGTSFSVKPSIGIAGRAASVPTVKEATPTATDGGVMDPPEVAPPEGAPDGSVPVADGFTPGALGVPDPCGSVPSPEPPPSNSRGTATATATAAATIPAMSAVRRLPPSLGRPGSNPSTSGRAGSGVSDATSYTFHSPGTPFSSRTPSGSNRRAEPAARSRTVDVTTISPAPARPATRAPMWTAIPPTFLPMTSHSPACRPARTGMPFDHMDSTMAAAARTPSLGASKAAKNPSPAVSISRPRNRRTSRRAVS